MMQGQEDALGRDVAHATQLESAPTGERSAISSEMLDRVLARAQQLQDVVAAEEVAAPELVEFLICQPEQRRLTIVRNGSRFATWAVCRLLCVQSLRELFRDPPTGLQLAILATEIADHPDLRAEREPLRNDFRGSAWTYRGNAHRALSQHLEAEDAFRRARQFLGDGTGDPIESARLAEFEGYLFFHLRKYDAAETKFERARRAYLRAGDRHLAGAPVIALGMVRARLGEPAEACRLHTQALEMIDRERDPRLHAAARHNLVHELCALGSYDEALAEARNLVVEHERLGDLVNMLRVRWIEADVEVALGRPESGAMIYEEIRGHFVEHRLVLDVALLTLELAAIRLQQGRLTETRRLASESLPLFHSLGLHREAIAAFLVFQEALERETATVELVREIAAYLRASRNNPELKFRP
jgi:tetratricopeptide (TPR) repeat protein